jgi:hypothetical protein
MQAQQDDVLGAGFDAFEPKPVRVGALLVTVRRLAERNAQSHTT